ncbi:MAG: DUF4926 domain-containing protein [Anaerolineales bacterium]|nr:DUF4926 domain-containing protein [Anaerolineales bacterium]
MSLIQLLDIVALLEDLPEQHLRRGEVGTVVESGVPDVWLVEFSDNDGQEYATVALKSKQLMKLYYAPFPADTEKLMAS